MSGFHTRSACMLAIIIIAGFLCSSCGDGGDEDGDVGQSATAVGGESLPPRLQSALDAWTATGGVIRPADLAPPAVPDAENAAVTYRTTSDALKNVAQEDWDLIDDPWSVSPRELDGFISYFPETMQSIGRATRMPRVDWDVAYDSSQIILPHLGMTRQIAKLLRAAAVAHVNNREYDAAIERIEEMLLLADHVAADPVLITHLVRISIDNLACETLQQLFEETDATMTPLVVLLERRDSTADLFQRTLRSESTLQLAYLLREHGVEPNQPLDGQSASNELAARVDELLSYLGELEATAGLPFHEIHFATLPSAPAWTRSGDPLSSPYWGSGTFESAASAHATWQANVRLARAAVELREQRAAHGAYPESADFNPPMDPLTGEPMRYQRIDSGNGFTLVADGGQSDYRHLLEWMVRR